MFYSPVHWPRASRKINGICILLLIMLLLSACGGDQKVHQQADQYKANLDKEIARAQRIGVPDSLLQPIVQQEEELNSTFAPISPFSNQPINDYYANVSKRYQMLFVQVKGLSDQSLQQSDALASQDLQDMEGLLTQRQAQGFTGLKTFSDQLTQYHNQMIKAEYPKDYFHIGTQVKNSTQALRLMGVANDSLNSFHNAIQQLQTSNLDVTALSQEEQADQDLFQKATTPEDFTKVIDQVNTQLQATSTFSAQAIPYVGAAKLTQFRADIEEMKRYGLSTADYEKQLNNDQAALNNAKALDEFLKVSSQIDQDLNGIQIPLLQGKANSLLQQFHQEVTSWGNAHQYADSFTGRSYPLDYEYNVDQGFGGDLDAAVQYAQTVDDYQGAIVLINDNMLHLKAMEADEQDHTPWNQVHATDTQLMQHHKVTQGPVLVVSLVEQALRYYQDGKLVKAFQVTTGQFLRPSPPGFWHVFLKESPTVFKSSDPKNSPFYYPDTKINFAMEYHDGGYFFHDSWWRVGYGPGSNLPHYDPGSENNGSHGCVNMAEDEIAWLYPQIDIGTPVILY